MRFSDFVTLQRGFDLPKTDMRDGPFPVLGSTSVIGHHCEFKVEPPGVVTGRSGSLGVTQFINARYWPHNTTLWVKDFKGNDPKFVYYQLQGLDFARFNTGAGVPTLNRNHLDSLEVDVPSPTVQRRIADILSGYDELIENCQRRIKILESTARALYREWFVYFRFPGHESVPLVPSSLGDIPQGWEVNKLGEIADISWGDTSVTKSAYVDNGYPAYSASGLDGKLDHYDFDRLGVVLSAIGAQCGKMWLARGKWSCIKNTIKFWAKDECVSTEFLFLAAQSQDFWPKRGAAQPFISQGDAKRIDILTPDLSTMNYFTAFASSSLESIAALDMQIQNLRATRDLLLPRLLSGQINVESIAS
jgi:type I restriction enzyme S subunit